MFLLIALTVWIAMNAYVVWRIACLPLMRRAPRWLVVSAGVLLASSYVVARIIESRVSSPFAVALEWTGAEWVGAVFLALVCFSAADVIALIWRSRKEQLRTFGFIAAAVLTVIATLNAMRAPVVRDYEVRLKNLAAEHDGLVVVAISDLHLGTLVGQRWIDARIAQVNALHPDLIAILGDLGEGDAPAERELPTTLGLLHAPLGVWAVPGNHEHHVAGATDALMTRAGISLLRDSSAAAAPGLIIAGVDSAGHQHVPGRGVVARALANRPDGAATILLSHAPEQVRDAARSGAGLMLAGHTHGGQIWPFDLLVRMEFKYIGGRYDVDGMPLIVCRGTGTWGPAMRLWRPNEIMRIVLRR